MDYSRAHQNIEVGLDQNRTGFVAVIATISRERGIEAISIHKRAVNQYLFKDHI